MAILRHNTYQRHWLQWQKLAGGPTDLALIRRKQLAKEEEDKLAAINGGSRFAGKIIVCGGNAAGKKLTLISRSVFEKQENKKLEDEKCWKLVSSASSSSSLDAGLVSK